MYRVVGAPVDATPPADDTTPSMPLAPRLPNQRSPDLGRTKVSTSRTGMELLT